MFDQPSVSAGRFAYWAVLLGSISLAVTTLGIVALTDFVASIYAYLPHVIAALAIFLVAAALSGAIAGIVNRVMGSTATGKIVASTAPVMIMTIATFMILTELMIAEEIVLITYAALLGAVALGAALAFGLGGREAAAKLLDSAVDAAHDQTEQVKRDVPAGKTKAKKDTKATKSADDDATS